MEDVIQTYLLPYDARYPVVCFDEACKQLFGEVRTPRRRRGVRTFAGRGCFLCPLPCRLDDLVVLHSGRARGHARHAAKAPVEVRGRRRRQRRPVQELVRQVDPAARGVHLLAPQLVRGTRGKTKTAMDTVIDHRT